MNSKRQRSKVLNFLKKKNHILMAGFSVNRNVQHSLSLKNLQFLAGIFTGCFASLNVNAACPDGIGSHARPVRILHVVVSHK